VSYTDDQTAVSFYPYMCGWVSACWRVKTSQLHNPTLVYSILLDHANK